MTRTHTFIIGTVVAASSLFAFLPVQYVSASPLTDLMDNLTGNNQSSSQPSEPSPEKVENTPTSSDTTSPETVQEASNPVLTPLNTSAPTQVQPKPNTKSSAPTNSNTTAKSSAMNTYDPTNSAATSSSIFTPGGQYNNGSLMLSDGQSVYADRNTFDAHTPAVKIGMFAAATVIVIGASMIFFNSRRGTTPKLKASTLWPVRATQ